ncbi:hypothetical protein, partial [Bacillus thuringiensis]|uniref:hypothetical protein n=1 Tax=Bacillus thuringiensis TaxID=1428 RepID=UPI0005B620F2
MLRAISLHLKIWVQVSVLTELFFLQFYRFYYKQSILSKHKIICKIMKKHLNIYKAGENMQRNNNCNHFFPNAHFPCAFPEFLGAT